MPSSHFMRDDDTIHPIDGKYGIKNNRLVKLWTGEPIPPEEPVILFRARDKCALSALREYAYVCSVSECTQFQLDAIHAIIEKFEAFATTYPERMKEPGITKGL